MDENMKKTAGAELFPRLWAKIDADAARRKAERAEIISLGYLRHWAPEHRRPNDERLRDYSTARRWEQYQAGEITRAQAVEYATRRGAAEIDKEAEKKRRRLDAAAQALPITDAGIYVNWTRSRTWGHNPHAEFYGAGDRTDGTASGCGYDKRSAAVAQALNKSPAALRILFELGEKAMEAGETPRRDTATGYNWSGPIGYGAGYGVLPYYEGGVGVSCFWAILRKAGYTVTEAGGNTWDAYTIARA